MPHSNYKSLYTIYIFQCINLSIEGSIDESSRTGVKGKIFDSSLTRGSPLDFTVGAGQVIMGWDKG